MFVEKMNHNRSKLFTSTFSRATYTRPRQHKIDPCTYVVEILIYVQRELFT